MVDLSTPEKVEDWLAQEHWMQIKAIHHGVVDMELSCNRVTDACRLYEPCYDHDCGYDEAEHEQGFTEVRHGVEHEWDGRWTRPTDHCVTTLPVSSDTGDRILNSDLGPGLYPVRVDWVEKSGTEYVEAWLDAGD